MYVTLNCTAKYEITVRGTDMKECVRRREGGDEEGEGRRGGKERRVRGEEGGEE